MGAQATRCGSISRDVRASADSIYELICPSGKKTSHAKTCPPLRAKIFRFAFAPNQTYSLRCPGPQEGRIAIVTDVGQGMRWTRERRETSAAYADGEVVWSWRSNAGVKVVKTLSRLTGDGGN